MGWAFLRPGETVLAHAVEVEVGIDRIEPAILARRAVPAAGGQIEILVGAAPGIELAGVANVTQRGREGAAVVRRVVLDLKLKCPDIQDSSGTFDSLAVVVIHR